MISYLSELISSQLGIASRPGWPRSLPAAVEETSRRRGISREELVDSLEHAPALLVELAGRLMVHETHFMRHPSHFLYLARVIEDQLQAQDARRVTVWSAGCSTGEEPYSVAMSLAERLSGEQLDRVRILATDISSTAIESARRAEYSTWSFRGTANALVNRFFSEASEGKGVRILSHELRRRVELQCAPLDQAVRRLADRSLDAILFRNVAIYLATSSWRELYRQFARVLRPNGVLIVAPADPRPDEPGLFTKVDHESHCIYRRPAASSGGWLETPAAPAADSVVRSAPIPPRPAPRPSPSVPETERPSSPTRDSSPPDDQSLLAAVYRQGDLGDWRGAIATANELLKVHPRSHRAYFLRGVVHLSADQTEDAVRDFRSAVFLAPSSILNRFWFASALQRAGHHRRALSEVTTLREQLTRMPGETLLEDGETSASALLTALELLREALP